MQLFTHLKSVLTVAAIAFASAHAQAPSDVRVALVIGNSTYANAPTLLNPANDAKAMGETLRGLGFRVIELRDGSRTQMASAITQVKAQLKDKQGVGMLYYAGHGLQVDARNYMVPIDSRMLSAGDVASQNVDVASVIEAFKTAGNRMNILVLDACRDNPFGGITTGKGLAPLDAPSGTFLAYATAPGNVAEDGDTKTGNGLYTQYLLEELKKPHARIEDVFKRVRFAVRKASQNRQIPWESTSLEDDFQFNDGKIVAIVKPTPAQLQAEFNQEKPDWERIKSSNNRDEFFAFVQKYPNGILMEAAHARLNMLAKTELLVQGAGFDGKDQKYTTARFRVGDEYAKRVSTRMDQAAATSFVTSSRVTAGQSEELKIENLTHIPGESKLRFQTFLYDSEGGWKGIEGLLNITPPRYTIPPGLLQVGRNWKQGYMTEYSAAAGDAMGQQIITGGGKIVAKERITVEAGTFETFKVEQEALVMRGKVAYKIRSTFWFTPDIATDIKSETVNQFEMDGVKHTSVEKAELVRFARGV